MLCKKELIELQWSPDHVSDSGSKRIYVTVNAAVFIINQLERRFQELENMLLEYDRAQRNCVTFCVAAYALNLSDIRRAVAAAKIALADELQRSHKMPWPK